MAEHAQFTGGGPANPGLGLVVPEMRLLVTKVLRKGAGEIVEDAGLEVDGVGVGDKGILLFFLVMTSPTTSESNKQLFCTSELKDVSSNIHR